MAVSRSLRRNNAITYLLAGSLCIIFLYFFFGSSDLTSLPTSPRQLLKSKDAASNPLSPPSLPFKKQDPNEIPAPPPVVHYHMNNVTTTDDPIGNRESVLILTPLARFYQEYWDNLVKLSYPHDLISLGFIIPKGKEGNEATKLLQERIQKTQSPTNKNRFASITIERQDDEPPTAQTESERHALSHQKERRAAMSRARNNLLFTTLGPTTSWVRSSRISPATTRRSLCPTASNDTTTRRRMLRISAHTISTAGRTRRLRRDWQRRWDPTRSCWRDMRRWRHTGR
jgi:mannan polymerase complexes MNN9 subunit